LVQVPLAPLYKIQSRIASVDTLAEDSLRNSSQLINDAV